MRLHELKSINKSKKRVGRGGKRGTTAGRGTKGQKSRSGHVIRPAIRDLILKLPKKRGFRNKAKSDKPYVFNLHQLQIALAPMGEQGKVFIDSDLLKAAGILNSYYRGEIKILGKGEIKFPISVSKEITVSESASAKILKAGGTIETK